MAISPEREAQVTPEGVEERPDTFGVPPEIEREVTAVQTQITSQVTDDSGKPIIDAPATKTISIQLPADPQQLSGWSQGIPAKSLTWFGTFWLRMIKKALHFGWKILGKGEA